MTRRAQSSVSLLLMFLVFFSSAVESHAAPVVTDIRIEGNQRVERSRIISELSLAVGDSLREPLVTLSVRDLFRMGAFSRVSIEQEETEGGVALVIRVTEFPMVR